MRARYVAHLTVVQYFEHAARATRRGRKAGRQPRKILDWGVQRGEIAEQDEKITNRYSPLNRVQTAEDHRDGGSGRCDVRRADLKLQLGSDRSLIGAAHVFDQPAEPRIFR